MTSTEFRLVAACCRWPRSAARSAAVREASMGVDWSSVVAITRRQRVWGLVADGLKQAGLVVPEEIADTAAAMVKQSLSLAAESVRLHRLIESAGARPLLYKGVQLAMLAYGTLGVKMSHDIDLWVDEDGLQTACAVLEREGYRRINPGPQIAAEGLPTWFRYNKEAGFWHAERRLMVEVHSRLVENPTMLEGVTLASPRQLVPIAGAPLETLGRDELFAYLCVHGASHGWERLKWLADVAALLSQCTSSEIERLHQRAWDLGAGRCSDAALLLCGDLLASPLPADLERSLRRSAINRLLVKVAMATIAGSFEANEHCSKGWSRLRVLLSHFLFKPGARHWVSELRLKLANPYDRAQQLLPAPLSFLYPLITLVRGPWRLLAAMPGSART